MPGQEKKKQGAKQAFGGTDVFGGETAEGTDLVTVAHGHYREQLPVGGMTVAQVRKKFGTRMDIDPTAKAILDGTPVDDKQVVVPGQMLLFARVAGEKGAKSTKKKVL